MYGLPISTERKKQLPKKAIFAKFDLKPSQRESFDADIARIDIVAVVSSAWQPMDGATLPLSGLNLDTVWENIVTHIGQIDVEEGNTLAEQIANNDQRAKLLAQISTLERKMANEKQPRRKREYFEQIKKLKSQI